MSFFLADQNGFVADLGSAKCISDALNALGRCEGTALGTFIETGETTKIREVVKEIIEVLPTIAHKDTKKALMVLLNGLKKSKGIAIISQ